MNELQNNASTLSHALQARGRMIAAGASPENVLVRKENGAVKGVITSHGLVEIIERRDTRSTRALFKMLKVARKALRKAGCPANEIDNEAIRLILEYMGVEYSAL